MDIDVNQLANSLNAKIDLPQGLNQSQIDYVVDWKAPTADDPTWYRVYKSGWVEQGGIFTKSANPTYCNLPKKMNDTNYTPTIQFLSEGSVNKYEKTPYFIREVTRFGINMGSYNAQETNSHTTVCLWQVSGQGEN